MVSSLPMHLNSEAGCHGGERSHIWFGSGFYPAEDDGVHPFRWMARRGVLRFRPAAAPRYLELHVLSELYDLSQTLTVEIGDASAEVALVRGWNRLSAAVPAGASHAVLTANGLFPRVHYPRDTRDLAVRVRDVELRGSEARHRATVAQHANDTANLEEMIAGASELRSTPPVLGIDLYGRCNVKPPCVFCEWDAMKALEGDNARRPFTLDTLAAMGPFFDNAASLVNCSIGEPFMLRTLCELLDAIGETGTSVEMSTNGQILTDDIVASLVGRDIHLYVSLDAARPETYARLRNDRLPRIIANLRTLVEAKGGRGRRPFVYLVFMPMRANAGELDAFVELCADLDVDRLVLRPLNDSGAVDLRWDRGGYRFDYQQELLPFAELVRISGRAEVLCRRLGVPLSNQLDFGSAASDEFSALFDEGRRQADTVAGPAPTRARADGGARPQHPAAPPEDLPPEPELAPLGEGAALAEDLGQPLWPACTEPWRNLYILRRGVLPCCYGGAPIASMDDFAAAWNGAAIRAIRTDLLRGRFNDYCLRSPACPIVRKREHAGTLPTAARVLLPARRAWIRMNRVSGGVPSRLLAPFKWVAVRAYRSLREPRYAVHHTKRLLGLGDAPLWRATGRDD